MLTFDVAIGGILSQLGVVSFLSEADECLVLTRDAIEVVPLVMFWTPLWTVLTKSRPLSSGSLLCLAMKNIPQRMSNISWNVGRRTSETNISVVEYKRWKQKTFLDGIWLGCSWWIHQHSRYSTKCINTIYTHVSCGQKDRRAIVSVSGKARPQHIYAIIPPTHHWRDQTNKAYCDSTNSSIAARPRGNPWRCL